MNVHMYRQKPCLKASFALQCRALRDSVFLRWPQRPKSDVEARFRGKRFVSRDSAVVCSISRLEWVLSLTEGLSSSESESESEDDFLRYGWDYEGDTGIEGEQRWQASSDLVHLDICNRIAYAGQLEVLAWARSQGYPWSEWTCARAAAGGHLETLKWLRKHRCKVSVIQLHESP
eukprot:SAG31_NODE_6394_length_2035_cov_1.213843_2_plen_175_part_00